MNLKKSTEKRKNGEYHQKEPCKTGSSPEDLSLSVRSRQF
jgi:hypothetical protein